MVVVFGSINLDFVTRVDRFPAPGETIAGRSLAIYPGGKGANQALAAARTGAAVQLYGAVGRDLFADPALALLAGGGVDLSHVVRLDGATGCATILVDAAGENCIAVIAGANAGADAAMVPDTALTKQHLLVLQHEVPAAANATLLERAHRHGARTLLNAAPARAIPLDLLQLLDVLVVNETEVATLATSLGWPAGPEQFALAAVTQRGPAVFVTLGAEGGLVASRSGVWRARAPRVNVVDTTGAGDAFVGALAMAIDAGAELAEGLRAAVAAGSLACTAEGAQTALPDRAAIDSLLPSITLRAESR